MNESQITIFSEKEKHHFKKLNTEWLEKFFEIEPIDHKVLDNPQTEIIDKGGHIFYLSHQNEIVGTVALIKFDAGTFELSKMAVTHKMQGLGLGKILLQYCFDFCINNSIKKLILYSNTKLESAIHLYKKVGFIEIPIQENLYKRSDIKMQKTFTTVN